jgi:hypothetical protein
MIQMTRRLGGHNRLGETIRWSRLGPGGDPAMSLQGLGETIWSRPGPGGDPRMSLQGSAVKYGYGLGAYGDQVNLAGRLGEVIRWGPLGPGGNPAMSLQGLPTTMDEVDWVQIGLGAVLGIALFAFAKKQKYIK